MTTLPQRHPQLTYFARMQGIVGWFCIAILVASLGGIRVSGWH